MKRISKPGYGESEHGSHVEVEGRRFRRPGRCSRSPAVQRPQRIASFSAACLSPAQEAVEPTGESGAGESVKSHRRQRSFSSPPEEQLLAFGVVGPNAHTSWASQSCRIHLGNEGRGRNGSRTVGICRSVESLVHDNGVRERVCPLLRERGVEAAKKLRFSTRWSMEASLPAGKAYTRPSKPSLVRYCIHRYEIERKPFETKPHCRLAVDATTGQRVFLKFYPPSGREFQNAVRMHRALQTKACACKSASNCHITFARCTSARGVR